MPLAALETASQSAKTASAARTTQAMRAVREPPDNVGGPYRSAARPPVTNWGRAGGETESDAQDQYHFPRAKPPNAIRPIRAMIKPIQKLQTIISTIPMITRMPPSEMPPMPAPLSALVFICSSVRRFTGRLVLSDRYPQGADLTPVPGPPRPARSR